MGQKGAVSIIAEKDRGLRLGCVPNHTAQDPAQRHLKGLGVDPVAVAAQTGHDVRTLYENYAGVIRRVELPGLDE